MQLGTPRRKSCTWPGPTQIAQGMGPSSCATISVMRSPVSASNPFMQSTSARPERSSPASSRRKLRSDCTPTEMTSASARETAAARSVVSCTPSGIWSRSFSRDFSRRSIRQDAARP